jgi:hypothetical protein
MLLTSSPEEHFMSLFSNGPISLISFFFPLLSVKFLTLNFCKTQPVLRKIFAMPKLLNKQSGNSYAVYWNRDETASGVIL